MMRGGGATEPVRVVSRYNRELAGGETANAKKGINLHEGALPAYTGSFHPTPRWN